MKKPAWGKADRFERRAQFELTGKPGDVFPLLCPVREYDWIPDWRCRMLYSVSGVAEKDAVFTTRQALGRVAVWATITYEPDSFIEYLIVSGRDAVIRLSIRLTEKTSGTVQVDWTMLFTAISPLGRHVLKKQFSHSQFQKLIDRRQRELARFLAGR